MSSDFTHYTVIFWVVFGVLVLVPALLIRHWRGYPVPHVASSQLSGFGGWLALLVAGQTLAPVRWLYQAYATASLRTVFAVFPNGPAVVAVEAGVDVLLCAYAVFVCIRMYQRSAAFPRLFTVQWALLVAFGLIGPALVAQALNAPLLDLYSGVDFDRSVLAILVGLIWVGYVWRSVRVRNTFRSQGR